MGRGLTGVFHLHTGTQIDPIWGNSTLKPKGQITISNICFLLFILQFLNINFILIVSQKSFKLSFYFIKKRHLDIKYCYYALTKPIL